MRLFARCRVCRARIGRSERVCAEHNSKILTQAEMVALYAEAMREPA